MSIHGAWGAASVDFGGQRLRGGPRKIEYFVVIGMQPAWSQILFNNVNNSEIGAGITDLGGAPAIPRWHEEARVRWQRKIELDSPEQQ